MKYPEADPRIKQTLIVDMFQSECGNCGKGAVPGATIHDEALGYGDPGEPCFAEFKYISTHYIGLGLEERLRKMRPDLEFIPWRELYGAEKATT